MFCQRAWMYRTQGVPSENMSEMAFGANTHAQHGRQVLVAGFLRYMAYGLLLTALMLAVVHYTIQVI